MSETPPTPEELEPELDDTAPVTNGSPSSPGDDPSGIPEPEERASLLPALLILGITLVIVAALAGQVPLAEKQYYESEELSPLAVRWIGFVVYSNICAFLVTVLLPLGVLARSTSRRIRGGAFRGGIAALCFLPLICLIGFHVLSQSWLWRMIRLILPSQ